MEYFVSGNGRYFLSVYSASEKKDCGRYTLKESDGRVIASDILSAYLVGGERAAVSDDGRFTATASYSHTGIDIRDVNGGLIRNIKTIKKIHGLCFGKDGKTLIVSNEDEPAHTYFVDIEGPSDEKRTVAYMVIPNYYGEDIVFGKRDTVIIGKKKIRSPSFSYLTGVGTPLGVCVSPACEAPMMYDYRGELLWKAPIVKNGGTDHIIQLTYSNGFIFALSRDGSIFRIDHKTGNAEKIAEKNAVCILDNGGRYLSIKGDTEIINNL